MPKPRPQDYATRAEYTWALRQWRKRTGGSLLGTIVLAMIVGALIDGALGMIVLALVAVCFQIQLRRFDGDAGKTWQSLKPRKRVPPKTDGSETGSGEDQPPPQASVSDRR